MPSQNKTYVQVHSGALGEKRIQFRFIPVKGEGHFGYLENIETGKIVHPLSATAEPKNGTVLVLHSARMRKALFAYDSLNNSIMHISGKYWHPERESSYPSDGLIIVLLNSIYSGFKLVNESGKEINPYPPPELKGDWKLVNSILNPAASHIYTYSYTTGRSQTQSSTSQHAWSVSAGVSVEWFSASAEYSGLVEKTGEDTWNEEKTVERSIRVIPGQSVVTWQWMFIANQYDESLQFESNIIVDTQSLEEPPNPARSKKHEDNEVCINKLKKKHFF